MTTVNVMSAHCIICIFSYTIQSKKLCQFRTCVFVDACAGVGVCIFYKEKAHKQNVANHLKQSQNVMLSEPGSSDV